MATRSIVTSQPDVACDVCGRRLLRGESPDTFLAGSEPRTVCELCVPRAAQEGWRREAESEALSLRPPRGRRGGSLLDRLRQLREPAQRRALSARASSAGGRSEVLDEDAEDTFGGLLWPETVEGDPRLVDALAIFNRGEQPRRVAGVARSLGTPAVSAQPAEGSASRFTIVVAWELCWYRYEVDLDDEISGARLLEKGMELDELPPEERLGNVLADDQGELHPVG